MIGRGGTQVWEYANGKRRAPVTVETPLEYLAKGAG